MRRHCPRRGGGSAVNDRGLADAQGRLSLGTAAEAPHRLRVAVLALVGVTCLCLAAGPAGASPPARHGARADSVSPAIVLARGSVPAAGLKASESIWPIAHDSPAQAVADLNQQRLANGIPAVTADASLQANCQVFVDHVWMNRHPGSPPPPSEPGPTVAGAYWGGQVGLWSATVNTFSFTPAMVDGLYNPMVTRVGYAETRGLWGMGEACMEVFGDRQWSQPIFYSVPGDGGQVVPWETAETVGTQGPPQAAVGIAPDATTGPDILLYAEGIGDAKVTNATLTGPSGAVAVKVVTPDMPYPASAGGGTVDTHSNIVIPPKPLAPDSSYTLNAVWTDASEANHTQLVRFRTESAQEANDPYRSVCATGCPHGHFGVTIRGGRLRVAISPAVGQRIAVWMWLEHRVCAAPVSPC